MRRTSVLLAVAAASAAFASVAIAATSSPSAHGAGATTIKLITTSKGKILANGAGFTLYAFSHDSRNTDVCQTKSGCTGTWPPLTSSAAPTAGPGLNSHLLGRTKLKNGSEQVTYDGHPLYRYSLDSRRGETDYIGDPDYGGYWDALSATGKAVK